MNKYKAVIQKVVILALAVLLVLAIILGSVLGLGNKCPEQLYVRVYNEDSGNYLLKDAVVGAVYGDEMTVEVNVRDNDVKMLLSSPPTPSPTPTPTPTLTPTPQPTPSPQYTGIRKYVEDRRYVPVGDTVCGSTFLIKAAGVELCASQASYGYNIISTGAQIFYDSGLVYVRTTTNRYELVYMSGLDKYFMTHEEYVAFCVQAGINAGGTL